MNRGLAARIALGLLLAATRPTIGADPPKRDFDREVAPLLAQHCLDCHGGPKPKGGLDLLRRSSVMAGGKNGPAVVPGNAEESLLWQRVEDGEMPPKTALSPSEKAVLRDWIASGAEWGTDPIDPFRITTSRRAGKDWWALRPVRKPEVPKIKDASWPRNPIDAFVLARLEAEGLKPSPEADRRTLIRRLSFDLIGLPPSPEEVDAFANDADPRAYEKLVDRLLASPHHGERWARHWLDVARFGESDGFERNTTRPNAWHYRDWLIGAFNDDLPYDEFARLQIAGDVLRPGDAEAAKATGFLVAGVHNTVLGNDMMRAVARQDELEEIVGTFGQTFLGLTIHCARCHNHKFDPIPQTDFYRFASSLGGVEHGEKEFPVDRVRIQMERASAELAKLDEGLESMDSPIRRAILSERRQGSIPAVSADPPTPIAAWDFKDGLRDRLGTLPLEAIGAARATPEGAILDGKTAYLQSKPITRELREKTLEVWVRLDDLAQRGGGAMSLQKPDGSVFDAIVFGEQEPGRWMAGSEGFQRYAPFGGPEETDAKSRPVQIVMTYQADGTIAGYRDGRPYGQPYKRSGPVTFAAGQAVVVFGCRHLPAGGNKMLAGAVLKARLYDRALMSEEVAASAATGGEFVEESAIVARLSSEERARRESMTTRRKRLSAELADLQKRATYRAYVALSGPAPVTRLLVRGQVTEPGEVVAPEGLSVLEGAGPGFHLAPDAPEADRRKRLAEWVTSPENPLFGRVMVNRLWHYHLGTGLVDTPNDFGFNGGRPSHPELLDWLASEFAAGGYRLKAMHRLIVTSATYRQSSAPDPQSLARDADNRLLWRRTPHRLEGEAVRDAILSVSGLLNPEVGGRGFSDYHENFLSGTTYFDPFDPTDRASQRRSIYRFLPRGADQGLLDTFDCPDPASTAPRRSMTTTPIQALALWNNAFVLRSADAFARRIKADVPGEDGDAAILDRRIALAWRLAFQREPRPAELVPARELVSTYGLKALGRALFNANEFLSIE